MQRLICAAFGMTATLLPVQELVYASPYPAEGQPGGITVASLQHDPNNATVEAVQRTAAGPGPRGLIENKSKFLQILIEATTRNIFNLIPRDVRASSVWSKGIQGEAAEGDAGALGRGSPFDLQANRFRYYVADVLGILNGLASGKIIVIVDAASRGYEFKGLKLQFLNVPFIAWKIDGRERTAAEFATFRKIPDNMSGSQKASMYINEERAAVDNIYFSRILTGGMSAGNRGDGLFYSTDRHYEQIRLPASFIRMADNTQKTGTYNNNDTFGITTADVVGIKPYVTQCKITNTPAVFTVECPDSHHGIPVDSVSRTQGKKN